MTLADLDQERCGRVAAEIRKIFAEVTVEVATSPYEQVTAARVADLVVQATPVGMKAEDQSLLGPEAFHGGQRAFDLIYHVSKTVFMKAAEEGGAQASNGLGMLLHQGARAFHIWTGLEPAVDAMRRALEHAVYGR
jgi:shikimate 5-dehydrogenase